MKNSLLIVILVLYGSVKAQSYSFFHPVPDSLMGDMSTDRPDVTESPEAVPAGHFQLETDLIRYERYPAEDLTHIHFNYGNYKFGLFNRTDIQLVFPMQTSVIESGSSRKSFGAPYASVRLKVKLTGKSRFAIAALPYYTFPMGSAMVTRNLGATFPMSYDLTKKVSLNSQLQFEHDLIDKSARKYMATANLGLEFSEHVQSFVEAVVICDDSGFSDLLTDAGVAYCFNANFRVDGGINFATRDKWGVLFLGMSIRI